MDKTVEQLNYCPICGTKIDRASGRCPKCGLLFGNKYRAAKQQQEPRKPQLWGSPPASKFQGTPSHPQSKNKPEPRITEGPFYKVKKEQAVAQDSSITPPTTTGESPAPAKEQPATEAPDATPQIAELLPYPEEQKPATEDLSIQPAKDEARASAEMQAVTEAHETTPQKADDVPSQQELWPDIEATDVMRPTIDEGTAAEEVQPIMPDPSIIPPAKEVSAPHEEQTVTQASSNMSPTTAKIAAHKEKQPTTPASIASPTPIAELPTHEVMQLAMPAHSAPYSHIAELPAPPATLRFIPTLIAPTPPIAQLPAPVEKQIGTEAPIIVPQPTHKVRASASWEPGKYQSVFTTGGWYLPPVTILDKPTEIALSQSDVEKQARLIEEAINSYGVEAKVVQINIGPTVTQFGVEPGWDRKYKKVRERDESGKTTTRLEEVSKTRVKVDRISALASDLALALAAPSIRIEAPVPGKSVVGIEVPNTTFSLVNLRGVIESAAFQKAHAKSKLALALGKGAGGETVVGLLDRMPHLLIAGATGSGKTACLNSVICCLLIHNTPDDAQFIMIDPKRVELVNFNSLPHLLAPVVVDAEKAVFALRWLNQEMDNRFNRFAQAGVRNIDSYNTNRQFGDTMPYIVVVIDELADLMMAAFDEVERTLCRLAQLARATGIHIIVATQRPSVDVVTGLIKANFPTRISFALTSQIDSRTILDSAGAEKLLGRGDMLYMPTDAIKPKRLQGTFIADAEIERIVDFWQNQRRPDMTAIRFEDMTQIDSNEKNGEDKLLEAARQLAIEHENISASFLQRRLRIGYPRAARIMEKLEEESYGRGVAESNDQLHPLE